MTTTILTNNEKFNENVYDKWVIFVIYYCRSIRR